MSYEEVARRFVAYYLVGGKSLSEIVEMKFEAKLYVLVLD